MYMVRTKELAIAELVVDSKTKVDTKVVKGSGEKAQAKPQSEPEDVLMYIEIEVDEDVSIVMG